MKPRASASFCHCPNDGSTPDAHVAPNCVSSPDGSHRGEVVHPHDIAEPDGLPGQEFEAEEILEGAGQPRAPLRRRQAGQRDVIDEDLARRRFVQLREQLDERRLAGTVLADQRHDRAGGQRSKRIPWRSAAGTARSPRAATDAA